MDNSQIKADRKLTWLTLFTSTGALICCALPIVLVTLGFGASVAALTNVFPLLIFLSIQKIWVFSLSGVMLVLAGWLIYRPDRACPTDPELSALCDQTQSWNLRIFWVSTGIWGVGFFAAFLALPLRILFDG